MLSRLGTRNQSLACGFVALVFYLLLPNQSYGLDSAWYALEARAGGDLFHPHHLLYNALGYLVYRLAGRPLGIDAIALLATLDAVLAAGAIACLHAVLRQGTGSARLAWAFALFCAFCYGPYYSGTAVEVYAAASLCQTAALLVLLRWRSAPGALAVGLLCGLGMLFHQTGVFFLPAVALLLFRCSPRRAALACAAAGGLCGGAYLLVAWSKGLSTPAGVLRWVLAYTYSDEYHAGIWGGGLALRSLPRALLGFGCALICPALPPSNLGARDLAMLLPVLIPVTLAVLTGRAAGRRPPPPLLPQARDLEQAMLLWLALQGAFIVWWEPGNYEFWIALVPALSIVAATRARALATGRQGALLLGSLVVSLLLTNLGLRIYPDSRREHNVTFQIMDQLAAAAGKGRHVVFGDHGQLAVYTKYFWGPTSEAEVLSLTYTPVPAEQEREAARVGYQAQVAARLQSGPAFLLEPEFAPGSSLVLQPPYWNAESHRLCYAPYFGAGTVVGHYQEHGRSWAIYRIGGP